MTNMMNTINMNKIADEAVEKFDIVITGKYGPYTCIKEAKEYLFRTHSELIAYHLYKSAQEYANKLEAAKENIAYGVFESREYLIIFIHNNNANETEFIPYQIIKG